MGIVHTTSAPYHPQSNGSAESGVWKLKMLLTKTKAKRFCLAKLILELNNMECQGHKGSPAAILWGRTVRGGGVPNLGCKDVDVEKMQK